MTTPIEELLRSSLHDLADDADPAPFLLRLDASSRRRAGRRRLVQVAAAAAVAAVVAAGSVLLLRPDDPSIVEPVQRPPQVITLSDRATLAPGRTELLLTLVRPDGERSSYMVPVGGSTAIRLKMTSWVPSAYVQHLSSDGTRVVRQNNQEGDPRLEIVDLRTGATDRLGQLRAYCPWLSPDNQTVVAVDFRGGSLSLIDTTSYDHRPVSDLTDNPAACTAHGWSPDSTRLVVGDRTSASIVDRRGREITAMPGRIAVDGSMSWSPDSRSVLLYLPREERYVVHQVRDGSESRLTPPRGAARPLGWSGSRIVWLVGEAGEQRLVTTDRTGGDRRLWTDLDVGDLPVDAVSWSQDLGGSARE